MLIFSKNLKQCGFSLIELMVAVALIGILATLGVSSYRVWIENVKIRNAAESIQTGLQKARMESIKRNVDIQFVLGANSAWTIGCVTATLECPDPIETRSAKDGSSASVSVTPVPGNATTIVFTGLGRVRSEAEGAASAPFTQLDLDNSELLATDSRDLRILIAAGGISRMCDPYTGLPATDPRKCP